ncbi:MAG TPA: creatininase family protein [Vicinamibacterales bacterium]|nr:creatininase family protein [Vicinamibacterales bacterium]
MKFNTASLAGLLCVLAIGLSAQQPNAQQTPEQRAAAAAARAERLAAPTPIEAVDSVWIEELTYMEVRDAIKAGKTNALVLTGGIEQNGPWIPTGKHNYILQGIGELMARKMGDALIAPIVTLEPGDPNKVDPVEEAGTVFLSAATYKALLSDMADSLRSQGFKHIFLLGDSGGNIQPMQEVAEALNAKWGGKGAIAHAVTEFYANDEARKVVKSVGIDEKSTTLDGIHDEYFISAEMMAWDPKGIRYEQRAKANKLTINGISLADKEKVIQHGKMIYERKADIGVAAMRKAMQQARPSQ